MRLVDCYCGIGGWSAGAIAAGCTPILGIDCDERPLRLWRTNCPAGRAACATLGGDEPVDWPEPAPDLHVHLSPPCTDLSKARAGGASAASVAAALEGVRGAVRLVLDAADYGVPSNRVRLIASTPAVVRALKELPVERVSVAEAFAAAGLPPPPAQFLKSNTSNRDGTPCMRSVQGLSLIHI